MMHRRELLKSAGGILLAGSARSLFAKAPDIHFPVAPRERIAVASYPFRDDIVHSGPNRPIPMPLTAFPKMVVERFNVHNVELLGEHFPSTEPAYLVQLKKAADDVHVRIINLPVGTRTSVYDADAQKRASAVEDAKRWVDAAVALDCPSIRVSIRPAKDSKPDVERAADSLRAVAQYGEKRNVVINLENDDPRSESAQFIVQVIERAETPWLHALPDFCNSMLLGGPDYNYDAVRAMFAHAYNISHVKDSEVDGAKVYRVDVDKTFAIAKASGYKGYYSMEWEGGPDPYAGTRKLIEMTVRNLS